MDARERWLKAEDVDWFLLARHLAPGGGARVKRVRTEAASSPSEGAKGDPASEDAQQARTERLQARTIASLEDLGLEDIHGSACICPVALQFLETHLNEMVNVPRETVSACASFTKAGSPCTLEHFLLPLLLHKATVMYELVERILLEFGGQFDDPFLTLAAKQKALLVRDDESLLFWQRAFFGKRLQGSLIQKIVTDLDHLPNGSKRVAGAVMALMKGNGDLLAPYVQVLQNIIGRGSGVLVGPARKSLQGLASKAGS